MKSLKYEATKRDIVYIIIIVVLVLILFAFSLSDQQGNIASHLSLAGSFVSISLGIVAIVYTLVYGSKSQDVLHQIQMVGQTLDERAKTIDIRGQKLQKVGEELAAEQSKAKTISKEQETKTFPQIEEDKISLGGCSINGALALYWLSKTKDSRKASTLEIFSNTAKTSKQYVHGFVIGLLAKVEGISIEIGKDLFTASNLPEKLGEIALEQARGSAERFDKELLEKENKTLNLAKSVEEQIAGIDSYFSSV